MADLYCPCCKVTLPLTAGRCPTCGDVTGFAPNTLLQSPSEQYLVEEILGIGGMGKVYKALAAAAGETVVKELYVDDPAGLPDAQRRFRREAVIQASINHAAFPAGYGHFVDPQFSDREFMAMEFVEGEDLEKGLARRPNGRMNEVEVLEIGVQICDGLDVLHNYVDPATGQLDPIIHRDLKPANIILTPTGQIKILDLGIARTVRQSAGTAARATMAGTVEYASPQVLTGGTDPHFGPITIRDDIYALAATLFHLVMGVPFGDFAQRAIQIDQLPPAWQPIFRRAIQPDSNLRQRNAGEFRQDLISLLPANFQVAYGVQPAQAGARVPAGGPMALGVSIAWKPSNAAMINPGEYRQPVAGRVMQGNQGVPGVTVIPLITDLHQVGTQGTRQTTALHGDFTLAIPDVTVPVACSRREVEIIVEDPNTGAELFRDNVVINRPWTARAVQAGGGIAQGARAIGHGVAMPFQWARHGIAWPVHKLGQVARWLRNQIRSMNQPQVFLALAILFLALSGTGIAVRQAWLWVPCPLAAAWCYRARTLARKGQLTKAHLNFDHHLWRLFMPLRSALWLLFGLIFALAK